MTAAEARIRLEGSLELVEAGTERYRRTLKGLDRVQKAAPELEAMVAAEGPLEAAASKVLALASREPQAVLQRALDELGAARREFRSQVRKQLEGLSVRVPDTTLAGEVALLRERTFASFDSPPVVTFRISRSRQIWPIGIWSVLCLLAILGALIFLNTPPGALIVPTVYVVAMFGLVSRTYTKLEVFRDCFRLSRLFGSDLVVPLSRLKQLGRLQYETERHEADAMAYGELLDRAGFERIGPATRRDVCGVERLSTGDRYVAILDDESALLIDDKDNAALDAAVGHRCVWTSPRTWILGYLIDRVPEPERSRFVQRLTVAGLARTLRRDDFEQHFRRL